MLFTPNLLANLGLASVLLATPAAFAAADTAQPRGTLPPAESTHEPLPTPPSPISADHEATLRSQAGIGSNISYARAGVLELGGSLSFTSSSENLTLTAAPSIGWFFADNFELSGIVQVSHSQMGKKDARSTYVTALVEPSVHLPIVDNTFLFGGLGGGMTYDAGRGAGFALAPRVGVNFLVGRSGVLTPSATMNWASNATVQTAQGTAIAVNSTWGVNMGYTVMW